MHLWLLMFLVCQMQTFRTYAYHSIKSVIVFHLIDNALWGQTDGSAVEGLFDCGSIKCEMVSSVARTDQYNYMKQLYKERTLNLVYDNTVTVSMYHIHTWGTISKWPHPPDKCSLATNFTMAESEESHARFGKLFHASFSHYDGNSTTSPFSSVQRTYFSGLNPNDFITPQHFGSLIRGASFVASTCHRGEGTTKRMSVVQQLQATFRVDSLGKCMHSRYVPEGITLGVGGSAQESLRLKQRAISHYLFYLAFENTHERGYVTEKVFDALIAGTVPVYLGSSADCRPLMPHPKAAIYVDDFSTIAELSGYLQYLSRNESAYEEHRAWRRHYDPTKQSPLFQKSWPCRVCEWAVQQSTATALAHTSKRFSYGRSREKFVCPALK